MCPRKSPVNTGSTTTKQHNSFSSPPVKGPKEIQHLYSKSVARKGARGRYELSWLNIRLERESGHMSAKVTSIVPHHQA